MRTLTRLSMLSLIVGFYVGCSPVKFSLDDSKCKDSGCIVENGQYAFNYSVQAGFGKVDILIVNDNSASMSFEQARLGEKFRNFIGDLDQRKIDYRIAMTTTDVSGGRGGRLINFGSNPFLTPKHANREELFRSTIQRPETLACERFIANWIRQNGGNLNSINSSEYSRAYDQNCPSGDERGIYAANLVVANNPSNFIRPDAHLSVIFLSDEDVRSGLYNLHGYELHNLDQPATLVNTVKSKYGESKYNSLSVHAIVVKDAACLASQNSQALDGYGVTSGLVTGRYGNVYLTFPQNNWGAAADICSNNYQGQLGAIRSNITDIIQDIMLNCSNPSNLVVTVSGGSPSHWMEGKVLKFSSALPPGATVNLSYNCASLN